jgi:hypothetical protein
MSIKQEDLIWLKSVQHDLRDFSYQLNGKKSKCDTCSLNRWDNIEEGQVQIAARSALTRITKLKSLVEETLSS